MAMTLFEEIREYARCWINATGCRPTAVPMTADECKALAQEFFYGKLPCFVLDENAVPTVLAMDIYVTPDAKYRRDLIMEKK